MPIKLQTPVAKFDQDRFGHVAYELMGHVFELHQEMGRFFDEQVYQNELRRRFGARAISEFVIGVEHEGFHKFYRVDFIVDGGAVFEFKTVRKLLDAHRAQLIHYLMLLELQHGKLVNFRPDQVEHEFVNCSVSASQRKNFQVEYEVWRCATPGSRAFQDGILSLLNDWGTGLEATLYEEAITHRFGGETMVQSDIDVVREGHRLGSHRVQLIEPRRAFKVTSLSKGTDSYRSHLKRLVDHTNLDAVLWANVTLGAVRFCEVTKS